MQRLQVYISKTQFNNLAHECSVLIHVFYPNHLVELTTKKDRSDISVEIDGDSFYIRLNGLGVENQKDSYGYKVTTDLRYQVKAALFECLAKRTGYSPAWGILQGIRPTKLVFKIKNELSQKQSIEALHEAIEQRLTSKYKVSKAMAKLAIEVASYEEGYLKTDKDHSYPVASIYVGIPYCPTRCLYCSFPSNGLEKYEQTHDAYMIALKKELNAILPLVKDTHQLSALYIGGGTPTTLSAEELQELLKHIDGITPLKDYQEITVEAGRPDTITKEKLEVLKQMGVQRISINPQTMNQETLDLIGRKHSVESIKDAYILAKEVGIERINMDLILGLPNEHMKQIRQTFEAIQGLKPSEVTVHTLAIKNSSRLKEKQEGYSMAQREEMEDILAFSRQVLIEQMHMQPYYLYRQKNMVASYENIGYTSGFPCLYNMQIIEEAISIYAFGAGSTTKVCQPNGRLERVENVKNVDIYIERIEEMIKRKGRYFTEFQK